MSKCKTIDCDKETTHHIKVKPKGMGGVTFTMMSCDEHTETIQEDIKELAFQKGLDIEVVKLN